MFFSDAYVFGNSTVRLDGVLDFVVYPADQFSCFLQSRPYPFDVAGHLGAHAPTSVHSAHPDRPPQRVPIEGEVVLPKFLVRGEERGAVRMIRVRAQPEISGHPMKALVRVPIVIGGIDQADELEARTGEHIDNGDQGAVNPVRKVDSRLWRDGQASCVDIADPEHAAAFDEWSQPRQHLLEAADGERGAGAQGNVECTGQGGKLRCWLLDDLQHALWRRTADVFNRLRHKDAVTFDPNAMDGVLRGPSHARGEAKPSSDFDLLAITAKDGPIIRDARNWRGAYVDLFVYPERKAIPSKLIHARGGIVVKQSKRIASATAC